MRNQLNINQGRNAVTVGNARPSSRKKTPCPCGIATLAHDVTVRTALGHTFTDPHELDPLSGEHHNPRTHRPTQEFPVIVGQRVSSHGYHIRYLTLMGMEGGTRLCPPHCEAESPLFLHSVL